MSPYSTNIVNIFERINRTGVTLSLFDLAVARLYLKGVRLRDLWAEFSQTNREVIGIVKPEFVLKVVALWEGKEPRKSTLLDVIDALDKQTFEHQWETASGFVAQAYKRITNPMGGYGAYDNGWIPYSTLTVPLAVLLHAVEQRRGGESMFRMVDTWYWSNVFTQRYDSAVDTKSHQDMKDFLQLVDEGTSPGWMQRISVDGLDLNVDEPRSAVYRGLMCLVVMKGARDFINGQAANLKSCEDDHIFPQAKFSENPNVNSILNRTLISPESNKIKDDKRPSEYLPLLLAKHGGNEFALRKTLESHFINEGALEAMRQDNIEAFLESRQREFKEQVRALLSY